MRNLEGRLKKLEKAHGTEEREIYILKWGEIVPVTRAAYGDKEFYRTDNESFDIFQSRVSDEIKLLPRDGPVRVIHVWMDSETRAEMGTGESIVACILKH